MQVELTRFKVKPGMSSVVDEWLKFLNDNMEGVLLTLERERMYVETIFREKQGEDEYLYWYSIQGEGAESVETSEYDIDKKHIEYWKKCIDPSYQPEDLLPEVIMIPQSIKKIME